MIPRLLRSGLKLRHLQLLVTLDQIRHLGRTAEALSLSAPAVSKSLAEIERTIGFVLFQRSTRGTEPTSHGVVVIDFARRVLADYARAQSELDAVSAGSVGRAHIGAMVASIPALLVPAIAAMKREAPQATVLIEEDDLKGLFRRLRLGEFDFLVGRLDPSYAAADLAMEALYSEPSCCVVHVSNQFAHRSVVQLAELATSNWVIPQPWATMRPRVELMFRLNGLSMPTDVVETASFLAMLSLLRARGAVTILARSVASAFEDEGVLKILPIDVPFVMAPIGIISLEGHKASAAATLMVKHLREVGRSLSEKTSH
ncbi:Galactose-binding protein regulator [Achromobacter xylosoxidans]|uniref:LysR substrate-binding domain-containing protein n=1 Tax=Alcaligenes xylosoxydans xylosoxydans TaxID=85698 RepID=UPI0006C19FD9|nr:LysR substrate-binding domain-containing protein [Achromobacter xylosoxidans]CUJ66420.1 Galactose-binding protein regulator [Achromobacter xylosoxidans]